MRFLAKIISKVFDPIVLVPLTLVLVSSMAYLNGYRWRFMTLLFFLDAVIPGLMFLWLWGVKKHFRDWDFHKREERLPLFLTVAVTHGVSVMVAYLIERHPLAEILLALWLVAVVFTVITLFWKISVHAGVISTLATVVYFLMGHQFWWVFLVVPVVAWARVYDEKHDIYQVTVGGLLPVLIVSLLFRLFGVV